MIAERDTSFPYLKLSPPKPFTHIIVYSTGFNTAQWESLASYKVLLSNLVDAAEPWYPCLFSTWIWFDACKFNPLFIGISWQSFTSILNRDETVWGIDFLWATKRADKIGKGLAVSLLKKLLLPLKQEYELPIILIGHSLGAKILSQAAYSIKSDDDEPLIDLLIGLQGAFRIERHVSKSEKFYQYKHTEGRVKSVFYTASKNDSILKKLKKIRYNSIGLAEVQEKAEVIYTDTFSFTKVDEDGTISGLEKCGNNKPVLVNANDLIKQNPDGGVSGAHSDIHHKEMGVFIWNLINRCVSD